MLRRECLNGIWYFVPFYDNCEPGETVDTSSHTAEEIKVPSCWKMTRYDSFEESAEAQEMRMYNVFGYPDRWNSAYSGIAGRKLRILRNADERVWLIFNGILQRSKIYLNDRLIYSTLEAFLPIKLDITLYLDGLEQEIDIKVWCGSFLSADTPVGKKLLSPGGSSFASRTRGIWQDVFVEYTSDTYIEDYHIVTSFRGGNIKIKADIFNASEASHEVKVRALVYDGGTQVKELVSPVSFLDGQSGIVLDFARE